jgi:hypothetical protein
MTVSGCSIFSPRCFGNEAVSIDHAPVVDHTLSDLFKIASLLRCAAG